MYPTNKLMLAEHKQQKTFLSVAALKVFASKYASLYENSSVRCYISLGLKTVKTCDNTLQVNVCLSVKHSRNNSGFSYCQIRNIMWKFHT